MERGRKPEPADTKLARGTFQPCRDAGKVQPIHQQLKPAQELIAAP